MNRIASFKRMAGLAAALTIGCALLVGSSAKAAVMLVDFGSNSSFRGVNVPAPDPNGNYWNSIVPGPFIPSLVNTANVATTVALGFDTPVGTDSYNGPAGPTSFPNPTPAEVAATDIDTTALGILGVKQAAIDFAASAGGADNRCRFQLQGLDPSKKYNLTFYGAHEFSDNDATVYSIYSDNTYTGLVASGSLNVQTPGSPWLHNRDTVLTLSNLTPQASNILYVQFVGSGGSLGYLNSMAITEVVPEPSGLAVFGLVGLVAARRRRRR